MSHRSPVRLRVVGVGICLLLFALIFVGLQYWPAPSDPAVESMNETAVEYAIHAEVNERRAASGQPALSLDMDLRRIARYHNTQMARQNFFGHQRPDGQTFEDRYERFDYSCHIPINANQSLTGGENLVQTHYGRTVETPTGTVTTYRSLDALADGVVDQWMASPDHRRNLLSANWTAEGIGVVVTGTDTTVYVTQNFC